MELKRWSWIAALCTSTLMGTASAYSQPIVYTTHSPQSFRDNTYTLPRFSDRISKATNGKQSLEIHGGAVLAAANSAADAISKGVVDAGVVVYNYSPSFMPTIALVGDLPGTIPQVSAAATTEMFLVSCKDCIDEAKKLNLKILVNASTESYKFICANRKVANIADVKGAKIRATGSMARIAARLGATPVNVPFNEVYEALQREQADCTLLDGSNLKSLQLWDVANSITTDLPLGTIHSYGLLIVNSDVWDGFTQEERQIWIDNLAEVISDAARTTIDETRAAVDEASEKGVEIVSADDDLKSAIDDALAAQTEDAVAVAKERGVEDAQAIADLWKKTVDKWTAIYNEIGADSDWGPEQWARYQSKLQSEIFDKVSAE